MKKFNSSQLSAITHLTGPCLVLAGPGSGKTTVLVNRIINLVKNHNVSPENILVITFTRLAATEMEDRFKKILHEEKNSINDFPSFGTFHSIFFEILREKFGYTINSLLNDMTNKQIVLNVLEKYNEIKISSYNINNIIKDINQYKIDKEKGTSFIPKFVSLKLFNKIYNDYEEELFNQKKLDFSDMINVCYYLLSKYDDVLEYYKDKYKYILIDEFQDINLSQYNIIKLLSNKNIFVVGDDDQSIYTFRGSHPKVMNDFLNDYKNAKVINLTQNYRCARKIVYFSKLVIDENKNRFYKALKSTRDSIGTLNIKAFVDAKDESEYIIFKIKEYVLKGFNFSDIAILYRTNLLSGAIKSALNNANIPFITRGEKNSLYDNFAVKDILAYLCLSINKSDTESLIRVINKPMRYINRDNISIKDGNIKTLIKKYKDKEHILNYIIKFSNDLDLIKNNITALAIRYIRVNIGYDHYLLNYCKEHNMDYDEVNEILDSLEDEAILYNDIEDFINYVNNEKNKDKNNEKKINTNSINLMTFHASKGLEFNIVFIIDANDGLIPHKKSIRDNDVETERRLFYVGMTRAKDILHIFFTTRRFGKNFKASRFILKAVGGQDGK